eukprot:COSAG01_NODE_17083_length_1180_cov_1.310823_1_plen_70_part_10
MVVKWLRRGVIMNTMCMALSRARTVALNNGRAILSGAKAGLCSLLQFPEKHIKQHTPSIETSGPAMTRRT